MTTPQQPRPGPPEPPADLTFVAHDLGRDEPPDQAPQPISPATAVPTPSQLHLVGADPGRARRAPADELPWTSRNAPGGDAPRTAASPWTVRRSEQWSRNSAATVRRLRQEAVNLSWTAAWLAVTTSGHTGRRRRRR